jgi:DnaJ-class molecular chaperone
MSDIYDIATCPLCKGEKQVTAEQMMKDNRIYAVKKVCSKCKGKGRIGVKRTEDL